MSLVSPNFGVKPIFFPNFGQGLFPKIAGKSPALFRLVAHSFNDDKESNADLNQHSF